MLWSFNYKKGLSLKQGQVEARTVEIAYRVAVKWAKKAGVRPPAMVEPAILADESILTTEEFAEAGLVMAEAPKKTA